MRVLLDECVPRRLKCSFAGHDAATVQEMGWSGQVNGSLLSLMAANGFSVLKTLDQNLRYQQSLLTSGVGVIVLIAKSNRHADLLPLMPAVRNALPTLQPGDCVEIH